ncbi:Uncharacterised protein [Mycobacteroides abscessus subsp. abscessus]|uniref:hypothetical protein n=1 Tax=Mycobacteroides abscessus TaxID=36809 RepID=UPI00092B442D|nr:hypothetical protein [Mycobacteroides abscessus]SIC63097.1 Uncharacterised protein [Mycobacteroides abscessus subsp. abscessus]SIC94911.1 Uncharacterised protein [Mycobacteroides abscessus subsp. abscessus]SID21418.1 Uncharacterised protein [Mycobacteroides abscessus subsp. abscessus]SID43611.1 Uncharacterised protein [Mycobacteroides abscessus subsp. abscessus]SKT55865.1 Uncharacterised protein [Mycobacteroides abscessus subsp. abscessus]
MINTGKYLQARCDTCQREFRSVDGCNLFPGDKQLHQELSELGWLVAGTNVFCPRCVQQQCCALLAEHRYGHWHHAATENYTGMYRYCEQCGHFDCDPPYVPPTQHDAQQHPQEGPTT